MRTQNPDGSWPAFAGDDSDGAWVTSLVLIALHDVVSAVSARNWQPAPLRTDDPALRLE